MSARRPACALAACCLLSFAVAAQQPGPAPVPAQAQDTSAEDTAAQAAPAQDAPTGPATPAELEALASLAAEGRWDEVHESSAQLLARAPEERLAVYWNARAEIERAQRLLDGRVFAQDLGRAMLSRAAEQLARLQTRPDDPTREAPDWAVWARYLRGDDATLAAELEQRHAQDGHPYAAFLRGLIARDRGEPDALTWLAAAAEAAPDRGDFLLTWAVELARAGQQQAALDAWGRARTARVATSELLATLAELLPGPENAAARLAALDSLARDPAGDAFLAWHRAWTLEQLGRREEAADAFAAVRADRTPELERAHATVLVELGRLREAGEHLQRAATAGDVQALSDLTSLGDRQAQAHAWDDAVASYDAVLAIEPRDERAAVNRALTLAQAGRSLEPWTALLESHPQRADLLNDAAIQYAAWGRTGEARALLERAVELPGALDARQNLADLLLAAVPPDGARAEALLDSVLAAEPDRDWALYLLASAMRARAR